MYKFLQWITSFKFILCLFIALSIGASIQAYLMPLAPIKEGLGDFTAYNNYLIFKQSFHHLIGDKDPYIAYPTEHWDLYKYSPAFSFLFGIFAILPDSIGLLLWNALNVIVLVIAVYFLPSISNRQKGLILITCIPELMTSLQNEQSNGLIAGLIILAFGLCERKRFLLAIFFLMLTVFIKLFGIVAFAIFLFYPQKFRMILYALGCAIFFFILPIIAVDFRHFIDLYQSWFHLISTDQPPTFYGYSVFGWVESWFHVQPAKLSILIPGILLFLLPFSRTRSFASGDFRLLALSSILIWVVIFNHMAESPTFIIAMTGVAIWFFTRKATTINVVLFVLAILLTSLSFTDIMPSGFRKTYILPYVLKAFPCILIWIKIVLDMMTAANKEHSLTAVQPSNLNAG